MDWPKPPLPVWLVYVRSYSGAGDALECLPYLRGFWHLAQTRDDSCGIIAIGHFLLKLGLASDALRTAT